MLPSRKANINTKSKLTFALIILAVLSLSNLLLKSDASANSSTNIGAQICQNSQNVPQIISISPSTNQTVYTNNTTLAIKTNWGKQLTLFSNDNQLSQHSVIYNSDITTSVPLSLQPGDNSFNLQLKGGCPETTVSQTFNIKYDPNILTVSKIITKDRSPKLNGLVNNPSLRIKVYIDGQSYSVTNHGDGSWTLPAGSINPELSDGEYNITIKSFDSADALVQSKDFLDILKIDSTKPEGSVNTPDHYTERSPEINGTVNEPDATVIVNINNNNYTARNNADGSWTLPAGTIHPQLASGEYEITITITDPAGNRQEIKEKIKIKAANEFGFVLPPNTGYLRIGQTNIPSWLLYLASLITISLGIFISKKQAHKQ